MSDTIMTTPYPSPSAAVNPLSNRLIFLLSLIGIIVAGLLWSWHAHPVDIPCGGTRGCLDVAQSKYASFPIGSDYPVAMYGFFGYLGIIVLAFLRTLPNTRTRDRLLLGLIFLAGTLGTLVALQLTFVEAFVLNAWCKWCVASQIIILSIAVIAGAEWWRQRNALFSSSISSKETVNF